MSVAAEIHDSSLPSLPDTNLTTSSDRRADIDAKQHRLTALLEETKSDGVLLLDPDNVAWITSGASARGILDAAETPGVYINADGRWLLSSSADSQRIFDEELDGLGFGLKEWHCQLGRAQYLAYLREGRPLACDQPLGNCKLVAAQLRHFRRKLTPYDQACYRALGLIVSHALEACCRTLSQGETEREIAGQLSHRLVHRGATPVVASVAADGRARLYRQCGYTAAPIHDYCVVSVTARKYGLCVTASRSVSFGPAEAQIRKDHDSACKVAATYIASTWPDAVPKQILATGRRVYLVIGAEHEWLLSPQGYVTGRAPVELALTPQSEDLLQAGWVVTWRGCAGAGLSCDTFLLTEDGPRTITPTENWPLKRIRIQGAEFVRPDILVR